MQRLFFMFPTGWPGLALLLMRASAAIAIFAANASHWQQLSIWIHATAIGISLLLCAGFLTPVAAATALLYHVAIWSALGTGNEAVATLVCLDAIALALLGPGAYSIDSYRFGRRVVVLPPP